MVVKALAAARAAGATKLGMVTEPRSEGRGTGDAARDRAARAARVPPLLLVLVRRHAGAGALLRRLPARRGGDAAAVIAVDLVSLPARPGPRRPAAPAPKPAEPSRRRLRRRPSRSRWCCQGAGPAAAQAEAGAEPKREAQAQAGAGHRSRAPEKDLDDLLSTTARGGRRPAARHARRRPRRRRRRPRRSARRPGSPVPPEVLAWMRKAACRCAAAGWCRRDSASRRSRPAWVELDATGERGRRARIMRRSGNPWYDEGVVRSIRQGEPAAAAARRPGEWNFVFLPRRASDAVLARILAAARCFCSSARRAPRPGAGPRVVVTTRRQARPTASRCSASPKRVAAPGAGDRAHVPRRARTRARVLGRLRAREPARLPRARDDRVSLDEAPIVCPDWRQIGADALLQGEIARDAEPARASTSASGTPSRCRTCCASATAAGHRGSRARRAPRRRRRGRGLPRRARRLEHRDRLRLESHRQQGDLRDGGGRQQPARRHRESLDQQLSGLVPDGDAIAYTSYRQGNRPLLFLSTAGRGGPGGSCSRRDGAPAVPRRLRPHGERLALVLERRAARPRSTRRQRRQRPRSASRNHRAIEVSPTWSPDGRRIAFVSDRTGAPQIYIMNATAASRGASPSRARYNTNPAWSPDGPVDRLRDPHRRPVRHLADRSRGQGERPARHQRAQRRGAELGAELAPHRLQVDAGAVAPTST